MLPFGISEEILLLAEMTNFYQSHVFNHGKDKTVVVNPFVGHFDNIEKRIEEMLSKKEEIIEMIYNLDYDAASKTQLDMILGLTK